MKCKSCGRTIEDKSLYCNWCGKYQAKKKKDAITVPKPLQLPSGQWRIQLRKEGISITAKTYDSCRLKAIEARKQWLKDEEAGLHVEPERIVTLGEIVAQYLEAKAPVLSPSTMRGYTTSMKTHFQSYMKEDIRNLNPQEMINSEVSEYSAKSIKNAWSIVSSACKYVNQPIATPSLPRTIPSERNWLDYNQIQTFLSAVKDQPCELAALLALHSLRMSEIFGLRPSDYDKKKQIIRIRGALLRDETQTWVRTDLNKNDTSRRDVPIIIPRLTTLLDQIDRKNDYIIGSTQTNLYRDINNVCKAAGLPETGIHGLRHSFASLAYHLGWKKMSTLQIGGWKNSKVLDAIYTHNADLENDIQTMREYYRE